MTKKFELRGFTLIEVVVSSFLVTLVILSIARLFHYNAVIMHKSDLMTTAAALAEDLSSKIKDQPFDAVFSFDTSNMTPPRKVYGNSGFTTDPYLIDVSSTSMGLVLLDALNRVRSQGFDGFKIKVTYLRRDSSGAASTATDGFVPWSNVNGSIFGPRSSASGDNYICDAVDPAVCFRDRNNDGDYWDVVGGKPETPDTGLKMLTIEIIKKGEPVGVKRGTILSLRGFSGSENSTEQSPLKLKLSLPKNGVWAFQATPENVPHINLQTRRTYPDYWFDLSDSRHVSSRIDNTGASVAVNQTIDVAGTTVLDPGEGISWQYQTLRVDGITDSGQSGTLEVTDKLNSVVFPVGYDDSAVISPVGYDFSLTNAFSVISGPGYLQRDGLHRLWTRKRSNNATGAMVYSPYDVRVIKVDNGYPRLVRFIAQGSGRYKKVGITVSDYFQSDGVTPSYSSGFAFEPTSVVVKDLTAGISSHTWVKSWQTPGRAMWKNWDVGVVNNKVGPYQTYGATTTLRLRDQDGFPWRFVEGHNYQVDWEYGDRAGYKTRSLDSFSGNVVPPGGTMIVNYLAGPDAGLGMPLLPHAGATLAPVKQNQRYSLYMLKFYEFGFGVDYTKIKVEVCPDGFSTSMNMHVQTDPQCKTIYSKNENVRPDPSVPWGDWFMYGYSEFSDALLIYTTFTDTEFPLGSFWQIRTGFVNSHGEPHFEDNKWRLQIVP